MNFKNIFLAMALILTAAACAQRMNKTDYAKAPQTKTETPSSGQDQNQNHDQEQVASKLSYIQQEAEIYKNRYKYNDVFSKVTDNRGDQYENLYGTRNFRVVLHGVYYRGGANNIFNRDGVRKNSNPLPNTGLDNLCKENFSTSFYFYSTNYNTAPKVTNCRSRNNLNNELNYKQVSVLQVSNYDSILSTVFSRIKGQLKGPIYGHCWNGWHASGLAASIMLKQFCGYSDSKALDYWIKNTDGDSNYDKVKKLVTGYKYQSKYQITADEAKAICPN
ncbi:MAG: hypothetical protein H7061_05670 [Bdellovibrionaceae bacterium]|nr:hypothetical protein [Bdellovibrio sp.]